MTTKAIKDLLARRRSKREAAAPEQRFEREDVAAAALMVECARIDGEFADSERDAICRAVSEQLALDDDTVSCLVAVAERRQDEVWHDFLFTETIRASFDADEQLDVIRRLWEVALADGVVDALEEHLIARIGRELGISAAAIAASRERARERMPGRA